MSEFERLHLGAWKPNTLYFKAWLAYYEAADRVDESLPLRDRSLTEEALCAGMLAMGQVLSTAGIDRPSHNDDEWRAAKKSALYYHERSHK